MEGIGMNYKNIKKIPSNKHVYLTKSGLDSLRIQLDNLRKQRTVLCKRLMKMDTKEKVEYISSTDTIRTLEMNELEVNQIGEILQHADIVGDNEKHSDVRVGSTVSLRFGRQIMKYTIVGSIEADPAANKISEVSPLGMALIGKKRRSMVHLRTPRGKDLDYKILAIS